MTIQEIREAGHTEIAELRRKEQKGIGNDVFSCFVWSSTKEGDEFWEFVYDEDFKNAYKIVPLKKIKKRIMKKDRIKEICKEAFKELITENKNEVRGLLEEDKGLDVKLSLYDHEKESLKKYKNGDKIRKKKGYQFDGVIVSIFKNTKGQTRIVAEHLGSQTEESGGMLHIFSPSQLDKVEKN